jgi:O-antigen ligase
MIFPKSRALLRTNWRNYLSWLLATLVGGFIIAYPSAAVAILGEKYAVQRIAQIALLLIVGIVILIWCVHFFVEAVRSYFVKQQHQQDKNSSLKALDVLRDNSSLLQTMPTNIDWLLMAIAASGFVSSLLAAHIGFALLEWSYTILLIALAYVISYWIQTNQTKHWLQAVSITTLASLGIYCFLTLVYFVASLSNNYRYTTGLLTDIGFENPRFASGYQILLLPLLFWLSKVDAGWIRRYRFFVYTLSGFGLMLCAVTQSRGTLLFIIGATVFITSINLQALKSWMRFLFFSSIIGIMLGFTMFWLPSQFGWILDVDGQRTNIAGMVSLSMREKIWLIAASHIYEAPVWGIGPMHFAAFDNDGNGAHPHNIYLQIWAEWGSISFGLLLVVLFLALKKIVSNTKKLFTHLASNEPIKNESQSQNFYVLSVALVAAYGGMLFFGLVDGLFVYPVTQVIIAVLVGVGIGITRRINTIFSTNADAIFKRVSLQKKKIHWLYHLRIFCVMILMMPSITTIIKTVPMQIPQTEIDEEHYFELHSNYNLTPRFWRQGWFTYASLPTRKRPKPSSD